MRWVFFLFPPFSRKPEQFPFSIHTVILSPFLVDGTIRNHIFHSVRDIRILVQLNEDVSTMGFKTQSRDPVIALLTYFSRSQFLHMSQMTSE